MHAAVRFSAGPSQGCRWIQIAVHQEVEIDVQNAGDKCRFSEPNSSGALFEPGDGRRV